MPCVYILCGYAFSGKTTLAKALLEELDLVRVSIDEINTVRGVGLNNAWITLEDWDLTYAESYRQLAAYLQAGRSVVYDAGNFNRAERDLASLIAAQHNAKAQVVYITTSAEIVRQRWLSNRQTHKRGDVRDDYFEHGLAQFEPPDDTEHPWFYRNEQDIHEWIVAHIAMIDESQR